MIEGGIGAVKSNRYNFHRPRARSVRMMGTSGQLAVLGCQSLLERPHLLSFPDAL